MIKSIRLSYGPSGDSSKLNFHPGSMTVVVGPNNSGKSLLLREIEKYCGRVTSTTPIIDLIEIEMPVSWAEAQTQLQLRTRERLAELENDQSVTIARNTQHSGQGESSYGTSLGHIRQAFARGGTDQELLKYLLLPFLLRLDGKTRLSLVEPRPLGDLAKHPKNAVASLFQNDVARKKLRSLIFEAFETYLVIDPTKVGEARIKLSAVPPQDDAEEQALDARARKFHQAAVDIETLSDGVKAFAGLLIAITSADCRVCLIDEPEAFLHPPLARMLGRRLTELSKTSGSKTLVATHSADFIMGCIDAGTPVGIVRLTYSLGVATARQIQADAVQKMMQDPLLRSAGVLSALFAEGAIITESDADRVFYQECAVRLNAVESRLFRSSMFLNAQNKQTECRIVSALRKMGIAAAAVVDLDIIKNNDLKTLMNECEVPAALVLAWGQLRGNIYSSFQKISVEPKVGGIDSLDTENRDALNNLIEGLREYGIFVVSKGELERWLQPLGITGKHGPHWVAEIFNRMGSDPSHPDYVGPSSGDVWEFLRAVAEWILRPSRKGMPGA